MTVAKGQNGKNFAERGLQKKERTEEIGKCYKDPSLKLK